MPKRTPEELSAFYREKAAANDLRHARSLTTRVKALEVCIETLKGLHADARSSEARDAFESAIFFAQEDLQGTINDVIGASQKKLPTS